MTPVSIVQSGSWLYYIFLPDGLLCSVSCFCISSAGVSVFFWFTFRRAWLYGVVFTPGFRLCIDHGLDMVFNASEWLLAVWYGSSPRRTFVQCVMFGYSFKRACLSVFQVFLQVSMRRYARCITIKLRGTLMI